jgi:hypothetical protein
MEEIRACSSLKSFCTMDDFSVLLMYTILVEQKACLRQRVFSSWWNRTLPEEKMLALFPYARRVKIDFLIL